jgi:alpha-glucosidase
MLLLALRGNVFLYQGEELGLPQAEVPFEALQDPEAIANWPLTLGRDGARTPMPWRRGAPNSGFSAAKPWLPVDLRHDALAVDSQETDRSSTLNFVRKLIAIRQSSKALRIGTISFHKNQQGVIAFNREFGAERLICVVNAQPDEQTWSGEDLTRLQVIIAAGTGNLVDGSPPPAALPGYSGYIARIRA